MRKYYKCTFLTDVVLTSNSATEGVHEPLQYIPGAKFMGIVASKLYQEWFETGNKQAVLDTFHNGNICFGDAHLMHKGKRTLKVPLSWYKPKIKGTEIFLHHKLVDSEALSKIIDEGIQLKQQRDYYIEPKSKSWLKPESTFSIKSAFDQEEKRSDEGKMFGYYGIKKGTQWCFYVEYDISDKDYIVAIESNFVGIRKLGRSKSAQYGQVSIEVHTDYVQESFEIGETESYQKNHVLYAESNLCFFDEKTGMPTYQPDIKQLGFISGKIDWEKSQIRTRQYQNWNTKRHNRDADRLIIDKGSVFYLKNAKPDIEKLKKGIGNFLSEGFGKVILNPDFLISQGVSLDYTLKEKNPDTQINDNLNSAYTTDKEKDDLLINMIQQAENLTNNDSRINSEVNDFVKKINSKSTDILPSQWGQLRTYAKYTQDSETLNNLLFDPESGFMYHGQSESKWRGIRDAIKKKLKSIDDSLQADFLVQLSSQMAKSKID